MPVMASPCLASIHPDKPVTRAINCRFPSLGTVHAPARQCEPVSCATAATHSLIENDASHDPAPPSLERTSHIPDVSAREQQQSRSQTADHPALAYTLGN